MNESHINDNESDPVIPAESTTIKDYGNIDRIKLDRHFRRLWRSLLSLESYPLVLEEHCKLLQDRFDNDNSFEDNEKEYLKDKLMEYQDKFNLENQTNEKRRCEVCNHLTCATQYCEFCIRDYLERNFDKWNSERLDRTQMIVLKELIGSSKGDGEWLDEITSHTYIDKIAQYILPCYGITRYPKTGNFMLVLNVMESNLQRFLIDNGINDILTIWRKIRELRIKLIEAVDKVTEKGDKFSEEKFYNISMPKISLTKEQKFKAAMSTSRLHNFGKISSKPINVTS
ncbi:150_t:CDS:2, partial [Dentiscutata erythropus]